MKHYNAKYRYTKVWLCFTFCGPKQLYKNSPDSQKPTYMLIVISNTHVVYTCSYLQSKCSKTCLVHTRILQISDRAKFCGDPGKIFNKCLQNLVLKKNLSIIANLRIQIYKELVLSPVEVKNNEILNLYNKNPYTCIFKSQQYQMTLQFE